ncbi:DUF4175 family protein [Mucilaginibacter psychrotolerans]|uniref:DUF4175 family protein n=1 Tax=Mucilaginibacter psychrotolerans TaxID=1524096 RepID=A0A4Y8SG48_9SPHI|nr:DUF4175 family protein [Mucilaginibacter psychrotolerans]TFF37999.1 DUF4175 family protein [Mucilaginibacter psychrotolerans]
MAKQALHKIDALRRRWVVYQVLADAALSAAIALLAAGVFLLLGWLVWWAFPVFWSVFSIMLVLHCPWRIGNQKIVSFLDREYLELQESTGLLLLPAEELNVLQSLARANTEEAWANLQVGHKLFAKRFLRSALLMALAALFFIAIVILYHPANGGNSRTRGIGIAEQKFPMEKPLPQIDGIGVTITPPAYTRRAQRSQDRFNISVEDGASVNWHISTNVAVKQPYLLFNDKERISLRNTGEGKTWQAAKTISGPGYYQVSIDGKLSELYQVQVIKDAPPVIQVKTPKPYTYIDAGEAQRVTIDAALTDDYGIANAQIMATVAKGRGEGVKFKEYKLNFNTVFTGQPQYDAQKLVDLPALNMEPGDELYFYVQARDTHQQQSRTDVFTVAVQDTAELLSMDGILSGANLKPEFFRSERQIIIDAEQLLKDKDSITVEKFNARSNDLGIDQKLLRLRYGKFLGEEDESQEVPKTSDGVADPADFSNAAKILKEYTDDHDKAEDAQFFEPAIKAQLKATLTEMWKAELQLRLYKPQAALPFAYKALRLLKDLQQKSRSFVAKTSYNPSPIKLDKRLTGELDKIIQPVNKQEIKPAGDAFGALRKAIEVLEQLKAKPTLTTADARVLQVANQQLSLRASAQPGTYLSALGAMRRILSAQKISAIDIGVVERAIQITITAPQVLPSAKAQPADGGLSRSYYKNLKNAKP